jgi:hypothetical protein
MGEAGYQREEVVAIVPVVRQVIMQPGARIKARKGEDYV